MMHQRYPHAGQRSSRLSERDDLFQLVEQAANVDRYEPIPVADAEEASMEEWAHCQWGALEDA